MNQAIIDDLQEKVETLLSALAAINDSLMGGSGSLADYRRAKVEYLDAKIELEREKERQ